MTTRIIGLGSPGLIWRAQLAEVWLIWYAETAGLVDMNRRGHTQVVKQPFGE